MSPWIQTPVHDRRFFPQYNQLSDFLDGHASVSEINSIPSNEESGAAVCVFRTNIKYWNHFPHTMQQLYRCTAWWLANYPKRQPILLMGQYRQLYKSEFIAGYLHLLQTTIGLQVKRRYNNGAPYPDTLTVQPKDTGKWHMDISITDYALIDPQRQLRALLLSQWANDTTPHTSFLAKYHKENPTFPRIAILNRDMTSGRHLLNAQAIAREIRANFPKHTVRIVYFENRTFADQVRFFAAETDIVITPHGAQLTGMAFLPPCAAVLELFPPNYLVPDFFGSLAAAMNISHSFFYLGDNLEDHNVILPHEKYHYYIPDDPNKGASQCPHVAKIVDAVNILVQNWQLCRSTASDAPPATSVSRSETEAVVEADSNVTPPPQRVVDILGISLTVTTTDSTDQGTMHSLHATALGLHPLVRQYYSMSAANDTTANEATCRSDLMSKQASWSAFCRSGTRKRRDRASISRKIRSSLSQSPTSDAAMTPGAWCAQQRLTTGLHRVLEEYRRSGIERLPDCLILMPENTYLGNNLDELLRTESESSEEDPQVRASCTDTLRPTDLHLVYPIPQSVIALNQAALARLLQPIHCDNRGGPASVDAFSKWTCWRLWQNHLGERRFFRDGMSVGDLLFEYSSKVISSESSVNKWYHIGYCMPSHHLLGYFVSFYHIAVPNWILNAMDAPNDRLRIDFGIQKWKDHGECDKGASSCAPSDSRICHSVTSLERMRELYAPEQ